MLRSGRDELPPWTGMNFNKFFKAERAIIGAIITVASLVAIAFTVYFHFEGKFIDIATAVQAHQQMQEQIQLTGYRLETKILEDRIAGLQQRIWVYQEKYGPDCGAHRALCQRWDAEIRRLERQIRGLNR